MKTKAFLFLHGCAWSLAAEVQPSADIQAFQAMLQRGQELESAGRALEAQAQFKATLRVARKLDAAREALVLAWLGSASLESGRYAEGERYLLQCLAVRERLWGSANQRDPNHATVLSSLGAIDHRSGRYDQAERRFREALIIWKSIGETSGIDYATCLNNLASLRYGQSRFGEAADHLREAIKAWENASPLDGRLPQAMANLATVLSRLKRHEEADAYSRQGLAIVADRPDRNPAGVARLLTMRAQVLRNAKRGREARLLEERAEELNREIGTRDVVDISAFGLRTR